MSDVPVSPVRFRPIDARRGSEEIAAQIRASIVSGALRPGDRLPPQRELEVQFGVSRTLVAEALHLLEHAGLIMTRSGARGGSVVRAPDAAEVRQHLELLVQLNGISLAEVAEFRQVVDGQNAFWAAQRAPQEMLERLEQLRQRLVHLRVDQGSDGGETIDQLDTVFHTLVSEMAGNRLSSAIMHGIATPLRAPLEQLPVREQTVARDQLLQIAEAVLQRQPDQARETMQRHIAYFVRLFSEGGGPARTTRRRPARNERGQEPAAGPTGA